jgi:predicted site-specific integrase-resolvase
MKYYSLGEAAQICGVTPGTIRRWVQTGKLDDFHAGNQAEIISQSHSIRIPKMLLRLIAKKIRSS